MAAMNPMAQAIASTIGAGGGGAPPIAPPGPAAGGPPRPPIGNATGAPPATGTGAIDTGNVDPKTALSSAMVWLKTLKTHYPSASDRIDGMMAELQALSGPKPSIVPPGPPSVGAAPPPMPPPPMAMPPPPPMDAGPMPPPMT